MIIYHTNNDGYIKSFIEWDIVDILGSSNNNGIYMHIRDLWVHPDYNGKKEIKSFIKELHEDTRNQHVKYIYWLRDDIRPSKLFRRENCLRKAGIYVTQDSEVYIQKNQTA